MRIAAAYIVLLGLLVAGCRQEMADQPRYEPYEIGAHFDDSLAMRKPVAGTVPRSQSLHDAFRPPGRAAGPATREAVGTLLADTAEQAAQGASNGERAFPFPINEDVLVRGRQRFDIYCSPCHGRDGYGRGIIVQRGLRSPPSFHSDRLREAPAGHIYDVITNGYGAMYSYAARVRPADRWAIAAYVQALQLSRHAGAAALPDSIRDVDASEGG